MRVVLLLTVLAVVIVAGMEERGGEALSSREDILQREARDARKTGMRRKMRKTRQKGKRNKAARKGITRKAGNKRGGNQRRQQSRSQRRQQARSQGARQTDCLADVVQAIKNYKKAQTQYRQANRIKGWMENMDNKKVKAADQFKNASDALEAATGGGMSCNGGEPDTEATEAQAILKNCSMTAAEKCDSGKITDLNSTKIAECKTATNNYVALFDECIKTGTCDCFTGLPTFDKDMCNMTSTYASAKASKLSCNSPKEAGSFGACSKKQKMSGELVGKCAQTCDTPMTTTKMMRLRKERLNAFQIIRN